MAKHQNRHRRPTPSRRRQVMALGVTGAVSAGLVIGAAGPAAAENEHIVSQARGFFLSGEVLGENLDEIVKLEDALAINYGDRDQVKELNPLGVRLLDSLDIPLGNGINLLEGNGLISLGAVNQAAIANDDGSAIGASGAVKDSGAIAVGGKDDVPAANATVDLGRLLNTGDLTDILSGVNGVAGAGGILGNVADLELEIGALSAVAERDEGRDDDYSGDYQIADLKLSLQLPALGGLLDLDLLDVLDDQTGGLGLGGLPLINVLDGTDVVDTLSLNELAGAVPAAGLPGGTALPTAGLTGVPDADELADLVGGIGKVENKAAGVSADLQSGEVTVDLAQLLKNAGIDINNLPPNTDLLALILKNLDKVLLGLVEGAVDGLVGDILDGIGLDVLGADDLTDAGLLSALELPVLDDLLGGNVLEDLLGGATELPTGSLVPVSDPTAALGNDATGLLDPILEDLGVLELVTGTLTGPLGDILSDLISLKANVQERDGDRFTQRALQVGVLPAADLLELNLASASVSGDGPEKKEKDKEEKDDDEDKEVPALPKTGGNGDATAQLAAAGAALVLAGGAAMAGSRVVVPAAAGAGSRRAGTSSGRHARR